MRHSASRKRHGRRKASAGFRRRLLLAPAILLSLVLGIPSGALAFWTAGGGGVANASSGNVVAATNVSAAQALGQKTVTVAWTPSASPNVTGYRVQHSLNSGAWTAACGGSTLAPIAQVCNDTGLTEAGTYRYRVVAVKGGWTATSTTSAAVNIDTTKPLVTIDQAPTQADPTRETPIHFTVRFSEQVYGFTADKVTLTLDGATVTGARILTPSSSVANSFDLSVGGLTANLAPLVATIAGGVVMDAAGNTNSTSTSTDNSVTLDNVKPAQPVAPHLDPVIGVDTGISQTDNITKADKLDFKPNGSVPGGTPVGTTVRLYRAAAEGAPGALITTGSVVSTNGVPTYTLSHGTTAGPAPAGEYWYYVVYTDAVGNDSDEGFRQKVVIDRTAPAAPTIAANRPLLSSTATVTGAYSTAHGDASMMSIFMCGGHVQTCTSNRQSPTTMSGGSYSLVYNLGLLGGLLGSYTSTVTLTDIAGNESSPGRVTF